jgi:hypothetical protein
MEEEIIDCLSPSEEEFSNRHNQGIEKTQFILEVRILISGDWR